MPGMKADCGGAAAVLSAFFVAVKSGSRLDCLFAAAVLSAFYVAVKSGFKV